MTGFKNILEGFGNFIEKLLKDDDLHDKLDPVLKIVIEKSLDEIQKAVADSKTNLDDVAVVMARALLKAKPLDPSKLNN